MSSTAQKIIKSFIENRGGIAWLIGMVLVPSQYLCPKAQESIDTIKKVSEKNLFQIKPFTIPIHNSDTKLQGIVYYPKGWDFRDRSRCIVYHNPNAVVIAQYFHNFNLTSNPRSLVELGKCPIILYDYRGTGLNNRSDRFFLRFRPTYSSVVEDGKAVIEYALHHFEKVNIVGSSLGGGVSTIGLDQHLKKHPIDAKRVALFNHDSFSTTPRVIFPYFPKIANTIGWILGGLVDAETSMKQLIKRNIAITVLSHEDDPIIPSEAKMVEIVKSIGSKSNVSLVLSPETGHANLSFDQISALRFL